MGKVGLADRTNILSPCVTDGGPEGDAVVYTVNRVPTIMEKPGKFWKKLSWKVMENLLKIESHEILLRAERKFFYSY